MNKRIVIHQINYLFSKIYETYLNDDSQEIKLSLFEFLDKIKIDDEFSKVWDLTIEVEELTYPQRYHLWFINNFQTGFEYDLNNKPDFDHPYYFETPKRITKINHNGKTITYND